MDKIGKENFSKDFAKELLFHNLNLSSVLGRMGILTGPLISYLLLTWNFDVLMFEFFWLPLIISVGLLMFHERRLMKSGFANWSLFIGMSSLAIFIPEFVGFIISIFTNLPSVTADQRIQWEIVSLSYSLGSGFSISLVNTYFKRNIGKPAKPSNVILLYIFLVILVFLTTMSLVFQHRLSIPFLNIS